LVIKNITSERLFKDRDEMLMIKLKGLPE
jgi:hypothetical protein